MVIARVVNVPPAQEYLISRVQRDTRQNCGGKHSPIRSRVAVQRGGSGANSRRVEVQSGKTCPTTTWLRVHPNGTRKGGRTYLITERQSLHSGVPPVTPL